MNCPRLATRDLLLPLFIFFASLAISCRAASAGGVELDISPFGAFTRSDAYLALPLRLTNHGSETVEAEVFFEGEKKFSTSLEPGRGNSFWGHLYYHVRAEAREELIEVRVGTRVVSSQLIHFRPSRGGDLKDLRVEGPFFRDGEGVYVVVHTPEFSLESLLPAGENIILAGDFPVSLKAVLEKSLAEDLLPGSVQERPFPPGQAGKLCLMENFLQLVNDFSAEELPSGMVLLFPARESLRRRVPSPLWAEALRAKIFFLDRRGFSVVVFSPFPLFPEPGEYLVYRDAAAETARKSGAVFVDLFDLYSPAENWRQDFTLSPGVYREFPGGEGLGPIADSLGDLLRGETAD